MSYNVTQCCSSNLRSNPELKRHQKWKWRHRSCQKYKVCTKHSTSYTSQIVLTVQLNQFKAFSNKFKQIIFQRLVLLRPNRSLDQWYPITCHSKQISQTITSSRPNLNPSVTFYITFLQSVLSSIPI